MEQEKPIAELVEKIAKECEEAGAGTWTITRIVKELSSQETGDIEKLRKQALAILKKIDPQTANVFASFQRMHVRTSALKIEPFDRGNIIHSLLKETNVNRGVAENIGREVENKIKDLSISYLNTSLIREMVNAKLLEYGHEAIRAQYARIGMPVFEVEKKISKKPLHLKEMMTEFSLLRVIPKELSDLHLNGDIFIACIEDFSTRPLACSINAEQKQTAEETILETVRQAGKTARFFSWHPNINGLNLALSGKTKKTRAKETAKTAAIGMNCIHSESARKGFLTLHAFTPEKFEGLEIERETANNILNAMLEAREQLGKKTEICVCIDSKYKLKVLREGIFNGLKILNCNSQETIMLNNYPARKPLLAMFAVNLEKMALESQNSERRFFEAAENAFEAAAKLREIKIAEMEKREYLEKNAITFREFDSAIALHGLPEAAACFAGESKKDFSEFCEKAFKKISGTLEENWIFTGLYDRNAKRHFEETNSNLRQGQKTQADAMPLRAFQKNYFGRAIAHSEKQLQELIDRNIPLIEVRMEKEAMPKKEHG